MEHTISKIESITETMKLLSDPTRVKIITLLFSEERDMCVYEIAERIGSTQSATSHQLSKLENKGIVRCFRMGQKMCYEVTNSQTTTLLRRVLHIFSK